MLHLKIPTMNQLGARVQQPDKNNNRLDGHLKTKETFEKSGSSSKICKNDIDSIVKVQMPPAK